MDGTLIAWDIDGTLVQATQRGSAQGTFATAFAAVFDYEPVVDFDMHGWTDRQAVEELLRREGLDKSLAEVVLDVMDTLAWETVSGEYRVVAAPGALKTLEHLGEQHTNALLTGNSAARATAKILAAGLGPAPIDWTKSAFGRASAVRADLARAIAETARSEGRAALIIGDTPFDGAAASAAGIVWCAVATGRFSIEVLSETNAVLVLADLVSGAEALEDLIASL